MEKYGRIGRGRGNYRSSFAWRCVGTRVGRIGGTQERLRQVYFDNQTMVDCRRRWAWGVLGNSNIYRKENRSILLAQRSQESTNPLSVRHTAAKKMKNLKLLKEKFNTLTKQGKMISIFVGLIVIIILLDVIL